MKHRFLYLIPVLALTGCGGSNGSANGTDPTGINYTVNGTVAGLGTSPLVLQLNGDETLSLSQPGNFSFAGTVPDNSAWNVTVVTQPSSQTCAISPESGNATADVSLTVTCADNDYRVGGTVNGLLAGSMELQLNGSETISASQSGSFSFTSTVTDGSAWSVAVSVQPAGQTCSVSPANGTATTDVSLDVTCTANNYRILGTASGVLSEPVVLQLNGSETLTVSADGSLSFDAMVTYDSNWQVAIKRQPVGRHCSVTPQNGTATADVQLAVTCTDPSIVKLDGSGSHSCAILSDDTLRCWGDSDAPNHRGDAAGEMGDSLPALDFGGSSIVQITTGLTGLSSCARFSNGQVKCWGANGVGQLGQGDTTPRGDDPNELAAIPPINLGTGRTSVSVVLGGYHACALLDNGQVKCWGRNGAGQLGLEHINTIGDQPGEMGDALPAVALGTGRTALSLTAGVDHTCARLDNGGVKCWGENYAGQLGLGHTLRQGDNTNEMGDALAAVELGTGRTAQSITAGYSHTCALLDNNSIKCWGNNLNGQLGVGDTLRRGDNTGEMGDALPVTDVGSIPAVAVSAGYTHTCARLADSSIKCWGANGIGQLGLGHTNTLGDGPGEMGDLLPPVDLGTGLSATSVSAGKDHVCATLNTGAVKCWGYNSSGALGLGDTSARGDQAGEVGDALPLVDLGAGKTVDEVASGNNFSCARINDGTAKCWGFNRAGSLGLGEPGQPGDEPNEMNAISPVYFGADRRPVDVATGGYPSTCAVLDSGEVACWGENSSGQLGQGDTASRPMPTAANNDVALVNLGTGRFARAISGSGDHYCVLLEGGDIKCWGWNGEGQLGLGDAEDRGDNPDEMGDALPTVDLGRPAVMVSVTDEGFSCALLDDGSVKCWGANGNGTLGLGDILPRGDEPGEMGSALPAVDLGTGRTAVRIASQSAHTCALLDDGNIKCWGWNGQGSLGLGDTINRGSEPGDMGDALPSVDLGSGRTAIDVSVGGSHSCALLDNGSIKCWGANGLGQLGLGNLNTFGDGAGEMGDNLPSLDLGSGRIAVAIHNAGRDHTCASLDDGSTKCWGLNESGQIGIGDNAARGDNANEMGDNLPIVKPW